MCAKKIILASGSPRRRELLERANIEFSVAKISEVDESFPANMATTEVAGYLSRIKSDAFTAILGDNEALLTADTIVVLGDSVLNKPMDRREAISMLERLSGCRHDVITGVTVRTTQFCRTISFTTTVEFRCLTPSEIAHYVDTYQPYDKAGGYGIQEWIGEVGIISIQGSYSNVIGLPVSSLFDSFPELF